MKTALVTGCAGFIASYIVEKLLKKDYAVIGIDNLHLDSQANMNEFADHPKFDFVKGDITQSNLLELVSKNVNIVFHLAAARSVKLSHKDPLLVNRVNVEGTLRVLELAKERKARRFVFFSSASVYGNAKHSPIDEDAPHQPRNIYSASKVAGLLTAA